ncbi:hypothetical protein AB0O07_06935 [Streptomyces sp. NPDC093085]
MLAFRAEEREGFEAVELEVEFSGEGAALLLPSVDCGQCLVEFL